MSKNHLRVRILHPGRAWYAPALLAGLTFPLAAAAAADTHSLAAGDTAVTQALLRPAHSGWVSVIVKTTQPITPAQEAQMSALGADIVRRLPLIQSVAVRLEV